MNANSQSVVLTNQEYFRYWRACAWTGPIFLVVFIVAWGILGHNIPPVPADESAEFMANLFLTHTNGIRAGMSLTMLFGCFYLFWTLAITKVMEHIDPRQNSILPTLQLFGGALTVVPLVTSSMFWLAGAYRPEALSPVTLQMLYDMGWLLIDMFYFITTIPMVAVGVAGLADRRSKPLFPKFVCWFSIWAGISFLFELLMPFFKSGLFARQGWLNFWVEFFVWFIYIILVTIWVLKAIPRLEKERAQALGQV